METIILGDEEYNGRYLMKIT